MKAEERRELKQNELAEALASLRDWNNPTTRYTLLVLAAIAVGVGAWKAWAYYRLHSLEQGWQRLGNIENVLSAGSDEGAVVGALRDLRDLIQQASDPALSGWARLRLARARVQEGFAKPAERQAAFDEAARLLEEILQGRNTPATLEAAATFALAGTHECRAALDAARRQDELDKAAALYQRIVGEPRFKGTPYVTLAADRLKNLDDLKVEIVFAPGAPPEGLPPSGGESLSIPGARRLTPEEVEALLGERGPPVEMPPAGPPAPQPPEGESAPPGEPSAPPAEPGASSPQEPPPAAPSEGAG